MRPTRSVIDGRVASRGGRASRNERALKPPDRRRIDAVSAGDVDQALAISEPLERFLPLVLVKLAWPSKAHPTGLSALPAVICAGFDQMPLESGEAGEDRDQQLALRRRCRTTDRAAT